MENVKNVIRWGNSGGILLPKEWVGKEVQILLVDRTSQIKKEVFDILDSYFEDLIGIYLTGSYARNEQDKSSDIDIIAISNSVNKEISSGKYHISVCSLDNVKKTLQKNPIMISPRLGEAKVLLNKTLLEQLNSIPIIKNQFNEFISETKRIIKINEEIINLDKLEGEYLSSQSIFYSLFLRIRAVFLIKTILGKERYSNKSFMKWLKENIKENFDNAYQIYKNIKDDKKVDIKAKIDVAEMFLDLLKKEIKKFDR